MKLLRDKDDYEPDVGAPGVGLYTVRFSAGEKADISLRLARPEALPPARPTKIRLSALVPDGDGSPPKLVSMDVDLPPTGTPVVLKWTGSAFVPD